ncbi:protein cln8 [Plakobranchus ocellatus]|uniref:Protein cln8 n=1 Tax=Plakobranchus ocellatus TaxID=259542 RepID=A0AAV3YN86_9GAST|nr:protein cln8 [Plakobranchus ocellatus]
MHNITTTTSLTDVTDNSLSPQLYPTAPSGEVFQFSLVVWSVTVSVGVVGNVLLCLTIGCTPSLRTAMNTYVFAIGVVDFLTCAMLLPLRIAIEKAARKGQDVQESLYKGELLTRATTELARLLLIQALSVERYQAIARPFSISKAKARQRAIIVSIIISGVVMVLSGISLRFFCDTVLFMHCSKTSAWGDLELFVQMPLTLTAILSISLSYSLILLVLRQQHGKMSNHAKKAKANQVAPLQTRPKMAFMSGSCNQMDQSMIARLCHCCVCIPVVCKYNLPEHKSTEKEIINTKQSEKATSHKTISSSNDLNKGKDPSTKEITVDRLHPTDPSLPNQSTETLPAVDILCSGDSDNQSNCNKYHSAQQNEDTTNEVSKTSMTTFNETSFISDRKSSQTSLRKSNTFPSSSSLLVNSNINIGCSAMENSSPISNSCIEKPKTNAVSLETYSDTKILKIDYNNLFSDAVKYESINNSEVCPISGRTGPSTESINFTESHSAVTSGTKGTGLGSEDINTETVSAPAAVVLRTSESAGHCQKDDSNHEVFTKTTALPLKSSAWQASENSNEELPNNRCNEADQRFSCSIEPDAKSAVSSIYNSYDIDNTIETLESPNLNQCYGSSNTSTALKPTRDGSDLSSNLRSVSVENSAKGCTNLVGPRSHFITVTQQNSDTQSSNPINATNSECSPQRLEIVLDSNIESSPVRTELSIENMETSRTSHVQESETSGDAMRTGCTLLITDTKPDQVPTSSVSQIEGEKRIEVVESDGTIHIEKASAEVPNSLGLNIEGAVCLMNTKNKEHGRRRVELKAALKVGFLFLNFLLLWTPLPLLVSVFRIREEIECSAAESDLLGIFSALASLTAAMDPIIYGLLNRQIRSSLFQMLRKAQRKLRHVICNGSV